MYDDGEIVYCPICLQEKCICEEKIRIIKEDDEELDD